MEKRSVMLEYIFCVQVINFKKEDEIKNLCIMLIPNNNINIKYVNT